MGQFEEAPKDGRATSPTSEEMSTALNEVKESFENYKDEFDKLKAICDAFEAQNKSLVDRLSIFENLASMTKKLAEANDIESIKKLMSEVKL